MKKSVSSIFRSPVLGGGILSLGFYIMIQQGMITNELVCRYAAGHFVEYITVTMFFIGMVSLFWRLLQLNHERHSLRSGLIFPPVTDHKEEINRVTFYLDSLHKAEKVRGSSLFIQRLRDSLLYIKNNGSSDDLEQELRYLADEENYRSDAHYGMVRMFIWAIPILGFLGTVIGITMALGNLNLTELETTGKLLAAGLQVAFDTTALALSLVFVLYFSLFFVRGRESLLFQTIDRMVEQELCGRFLGADKNELNGEPETIRRLLNAIIASFEQLMKRQTTLWDEAIRNVNERTTQMAQMATQQVELELGNVLSSNLDKFSSCLLAGQEHLQTETIRPLIDVLEQKTEKLGAFKDQMIQEENLLLEILRATGEITRLEDRLNHNLSTLAGVSCFEETVNSLAATIHLLNTKFNGINSVSPDIHLASSPEPIRRNIISDNSAQVIPMNPGTN